MPPRQCPSQGQCQLQRHSSMSPHTVDAVDSHNNHRCRSQVKCVSMVLAGIVSSGKYRPKPSSFTTSWRRPGSLVTRRLPLRWSGSGGLRCSGRGLSVPAARVLDCDDSGDEIYQSVGTHATRGDRSRSLDESQCTSSTRTIAEGERKREPPLPAHTFPTALAGDLGTRQTMVATEDGGDDGNGEELARVGLLSCRRTRSPVCGCWLPLRSCSADLGHPLPAPSY